MCSIAFAQNEEKPNQNEPPKAFKVEEFGNSTNGYMKALIDSFFSDLMDDSTAQGYIITYGSERETTRREIFLRNYMMMRNFDVSKIKLINGGITKDINTELWIVPAKAELPKLNPVLRKFDELGQMSNSEIKVRFEKFLRKLITQNTSQGYIINYGTNRTITMREKQLRSNINWRCDYDCPRITFVRGGSARRLKTVFWIVPEGAEPPTP
jgi:hypothetical protein